MKSLIVLIPIVISAELNEGTQQVAVPDAQVKLISQVRVPAQEAGVLFELNITEGQLVKEGQVLGAVDDRLARVENQLAKLEYEIAKLQSEDDIDERYANKSLAVSRSELKRSAEANQLYADSVSQTEIERLQLLVDRSTLAIEQSQRDRKVSVITEKIKHHTIEASNLRIANRRIKSPLNGMVVEIFAQRGEWLQPGNPVLRVVKLDRLRVEAHLDGRKYGRELEGCAVEITLALPPGGRVVKFPGEVVFVSPEVQPVTGEIRIWAEVQNEGMQLRPGDHGTLTIHVPAKSRTK